MSERLEGLTLDKLATRSTTEVAVVLDPRLSRVLRPHQIDGIRFMFECVSGLKDQLLRGCIMADEMVG